MKTSDISETPVVRKYGVRGAKLFARIWFSFMYAFLAAATAGLWILGPEFPAGWSRVLIGVLPAL